MCYSATASFTASAVLFAVGAFAFRDARNTRYWLFSLIPWGFAVQQGLEGVVWLATRNVVSEVVGLAASYGFLVFAVVLWPGLIAAAAWQAERSVRRRWMTGFVGLGLVWALVSLSVLVASYEGFAAVGGHIAYDIVTPSVSFIVAAFAVYAGIGVGPLFISSDSRLSFFGVLLLLSGVISAAVATRWLASIWCFWAAVLSIDVYYVVARRDR